MNNWIELEDQPLSDLEKTRKVLHQAIQIVAAVPRNSLPHDPTDESASLAWSSKRKGLESNVIENEEGNALAVGLEFETFILYLDKDGKQVDRFSMDGKSVDDGLSWIKDRLSHSGIYADNVNLELPYEIEDYDFSQSLSFNQSAHKEFTSLFENSNHVLTAIKERFLEAYDVRCWPHHFDIATLIPLDKDENGELTRSSGIGLSPGDDGINEPYIYVNIWPNMEYVVLNRNELPGGHWNKEGWSGAVLTYSEIVKATDQFALLDDFVDSALKHVMG